MRACVPTGSSMQAKQSAKQEERDAPVGRKDRAVAPVPEDQRDDRDADGRHDRPFVQAVIFVEQQLELAVAAAARRGLDPARDRDRRRRQQHDQDQRFDPEFGAQGQRQEDRPDERLHTQLHLSAASTGKSAWIVVIQQ